MCVCVCLCVCVCMCVRARCTCDAYLCSRYTRHLYLYHGWRISASVSPASPAYIQPTNCRHTHNHIPHSTGLPPSARGVWGVGHWLAKGAHITSLSHAGYVAVRPRPHCPPPSAEGDGGWARSALQWGIDFPASCMPLDVCHLSPLPSGEQNGTG